MRKISMLGTLAIFLALGGVEANAAISEAPYLKTNHRATYHAMMHAPMREGRAAYVSPGGLWNGPVDYKSVGLSDNPDDCNNGCALSNGP
jgi:hypothetical protein